MGYYTRIFRLTIRLVLLCEIKSEYADVIRKGDNILFVLFVRGYVESFITFNNLTSLYESPFDPTHKTVIIIHGFRSSCADNVFTTIKDAYIKTTDYNIVCVNWTHLSNEEYLKAINYINLVGIYLAKFIDWIVYESGITTDDIHIIGHSLGAHIAGVAGSNVNYGVVGRITGLDPAVPSITLEQDMILDSSDASLVDLIFTSYLSYGYPLANVNYIVNGGLFQPHCDSFLLQSAVGPVYSGIIVCSHSKAYELYAEVILHPKSIRAIRCENIHAAMNNQCEEKTTEVQSYLLDIHNYDGIYSVHIK